MALHTTQFSEWVNNHSKENKVECPLGDNGKKLQEPCVTGTPEGWDSSYEKMNGKLSKNAWKSTKQNFKNGKQ